jgi:carboxyl-terminal processing protease
LFTALFLTISLFSATKKLKTSDIRNYIEEIFSYHVENRTLTPLIVRRSFKIYIEQFDPGKIYLLKSEVKPYLELSDQQVEQIINRFYRDDYSDYMALNKMIEQSIFRARNIRKELQNEILLGKALRNQSKKAAQLKFFSVNHLQRLHNQDGALSFFSY